MTNESLMMKSIYSLKISDIDSLLSLAINGESDHEVIHHLEAFRKMIASNINHQNRISFGTKFSKINRIKIEY